MDRDKHGPKEPAGREYSEPENRLQASRRIYEEVQYAFQLHDNANENLEKKAQNLMIASALVAALFASATVAGDAFREPLGLSGAQMAVAYMSGMAVAIALCILVNRASAYVVPIVGGSLLRRGRINMKVYKDLISDEERYYRTRIENYANILVRMESTNKNKGRMLNCAYVAFAATVVSFIVGFVAAIAPCG